MGKHDLECNNHCTCFMDSRLSSIDYVQTGAQQGWQCPVCKRILSPWTPECPCKGQGMDTWTTTSTTSEGNTITLNSNTVKPKHFDIKFEEE